MNRALPPAPVTVARVETHVLRHPIRVPVRTSFGVMHDRPALLIRVLDEDGAEGWGEAWCNFPACGAEHRARLIDSQLAPMLLGRSFQGPDQAWQRLTDETAVLGLQSGEPGPLAQAIAGMDLALWDLVARRAGQPLWRFLGGQASRVKVYASGINPEGAIDLALRMQAAGHQAFKLKIGFGRARDLANLGALRLALGESATLMADANQAWTLAAAEALVPQLAPFGLSWLEEPLRADRPWSEWQALSAISPTALAGGENLIGADSFQAALAAKAFGVLQPDLAKWGGISGCWPVIRATLAAGLRYCPHYLGAGLGLLASAHVLAASGADGMLEIDANDNPLRTALSGDLSRIEAGQVRLGERPGIGAPTDVLAAARTALAARD